MIMENTFRFKPACLSISWKLQVALCHIEGFKHKKELVSGVNEEHGSSQNMLLAGTSQTGSDIGLKSGAGLLPPLSTSKGQLGKEKDIVGSCLYSNYGAADWENEI